MQDTPGSQPGHHCFIGWFPSFTIILVGINHHPKGTTIFFNGGNDFQGYLKKPDPKKYTLFTLPACWNWKKRSLIMIHKNAINFLRDRHVFVMFYWTYTGVIVYYQAKLHSLNYKYKGNPNPSKWPATFRLNLRFAWPRWLEKVPKIKSQVVKNGDLPW